MNAKNELISHLIFVAFVLPGLWDPVKMEVASPEIDTSPCIVGD